MKKKMQTSVKITYGIAVTVVCALLVTFLILRLNDRLVYLILSLAALLFPRVLSGAFRVRMTALMECASVIIICASCVIGEALGIYERIPMWDDWMHLGSGFLFCAFGFAVWEIADGSRRALVGFSFATTAGVLWEFIEYFCDRIFYTDMQKDALLTSVSSHLIERWGGAHRIDQITQSFIGDVTLPGVLDVGLHDTMNDLLMASVGAIVFLIIYRIDLILDTRLSRPFIPYRRYEIKRGR